MSRAQTKPSFLGELLQAGLYKRNQGRLTRQLTVAGLGLIIFFGAWSFSQWLSGSVGFTNPWISIGIPVLVFAIGMWFAFRAVNYPRFADFLISVEAEMDKVSWPSRSELYRATVVVITTMILIGLVLFLYDIFWVWLFTKIGILQSV
jgi:preprotein translocase subunit SecE